MKKRSRIAALIAVIVLALAQLACSPVVHNTACLLSGNTTCYTSK